MGRLTFRQHQRMVSQSDFDRVFQGGSRARSDLFTVALRPNGRAHSRLGLSVGKRIWKSAVKRNYVRRIFREAFRLTQHDLPAGFDMIMIPSRAKLVPDLEEACEQLLGMSRKARKRYEAKIREQEAEEGTSPVPQERAR
jgi:ribonuclease P protein component